MDPELDTIRNAALAAIEAAGDEAALEAARVAALGKKGSLSLAGGRIKSLSAEEKPAFGQMLNEVRIAITSAIDERRAMLREESDRKMVEGVDLTLPGRVPSQGALHPLTQLQDRAIRICRRMGFALAAGPEVETEWHCFDALNTPPDHPARNESDTFYFDSGHLLRTHTSSVQIRSMETTPPPVRIIAPGSAYRRDEIDATHLSVFTQLEGLYVAADVTLPDLKGTLEFFLRAIFGSDTEVRFRPHFFPFTEPSFEVDVRVESGTKGKHWMEIMGCGMVDPAVFEAICQTRGDDLYDPDEVTGFAFGMGLDRLAMHQFGLDDIRLLIENDARFLGQFV